MVRHEILLDMVRFKGGDAFASAFSYSSLTENITELKVGFLQKIGGKTDFDTHLLLKDDGNGLVV